MASGLAQASTRRATLRSNAGADRTRRDASDEQPDTHRGDEHRGECRDDARFQAASPRPAKRRKVTTSRATSTSELHRHLFSLRNETRPTTPDACHPPSRRHSVDYHTPLLLGRRGTDGRRALLSWFDSVIESRAMPWRKPWVDPRLAQDAGRLREQLERRAYEVWISEIMLQQTRVAVVVDYWKRWMDKWPTLHDLARASPDDVLAAWRGLGYYSRATRIHEAAKLVAADAEMRGLLPSTAAELQARVPGVGRYTAGAISCIVFGRAAPMVDGNVLRVMTRQLGIYGDIKTSKAVVDTVWAAADALVREVAVDGDEGTPDPVDAGDDAEPPASDRPGRWGQALMELGSTVCTPKPSCASCPITDSCRAYAEGMALACGASSPGDMEDSCPLCEPFGEREGACGAGAADEKGAVGGPKARAGGKRQLSLADFALGAGGGGGGGGGKASAARSGAANRAAHLEVVADHARRFPLKTAKKAVRSEETVVCAIRRPDGAYLIQRRPDKGLLAGLWEFPSTGVDEGAGGLEAQGRAKKRRTELARAHVSSLLPKGAVAGRLRHLGELGSVPWLFSHLKLTMHVHLFAAKGGAEAEEDWEPVQAATARPMRWSGDVDGESMGTGMRKCWGLVRGTEG